MIDRIVQGELSDSLRALIRWALDSATIILRGLVLLLIAIAVAKTVEIVLRTVLQRVGLDPLSERLGLRSVLRGVGLDVSLTAVLTRTAFFLTLLFAAQIVADVIELDAVSDLLTRLLAYAPRVLAAGLIALIGLVAAQHARRTVVRTAGDSGIEYASALGGLVFAVIVFAIGLMAVSQLRITTDAVWLVLGWLLAGLALALGLSFGLGARDITRNILAGFYARRVFRIGREVQLEGHRGVLVSITPTTALIEEDDAVVTIANSRLLDEIIRQPK